MIIQGISIDLTEKGFEVSIQTLNNAQSNVLNGESMTESSSLEYRNSGSTVAEALDGAVTISGKEPLYAHNRIILIGKKAAENGLDSILDFFVRDYNTRPTVLLAVARDGDARDVIEAKIATDLISSQVIEDILIRSNLLGKSVKTRVLDAVNYSKDSLSALCLPTVHVKNNGDEKELAAGDTAVFDKDNKLVGYVSQMDTFGLLIVNDKIENGILSIEIGENETVTLFIERMKTGVKVEGSEQNPTFDIFVNASCDVTEYLSADFTQLEINDIDKIKRATESELKRVIEASVISAKLNTGCDIFRFGRRLSLKYPHVLKNGFFNDKSIYDVSEYSISVKITIRRIGEEALIA